MKKKHQAAGVSSENVPIELNSNYFFERAVKSLDMQRFDKALKYFKKALDYEPENPINYCNVAGVLSEMGNYDQANDILEKVIQDIDPKMTEVYFYMATNFAHMERYEEAENQLIQYLEEDEDGNFLEEAEEMIEFLQTELPEPKKITKVKAKAGIYEHSYARELLEQGQFAEAIVLLEKVVEEQPDFLAAVNNLALAYYYVGFKKEAKHYMLQVLEHDASNLHALCNLAIYYYYEKEHEHLKHLLPSLVKVEPFYQEHLYKLATTLGIMKEHKAALKHFDRLIKLGEGTREGSIFHYAAIASLNIKAYDKAKRYWQLSYEYSAYEPALYYMELTEQLEQLSISWSFTYSYFVSVEEQLALWDSLFTAEATQLRNVIYRSYFKYAKKNGQSESKLNSMQLVNTILDETLVNQLYDYVLQPLEDKEVKKKALALIIKYKVSEASKETINITPKQLKNIEGWYFVFELACQRVETMLTEEIKENILSLLIRFVVLTLKQQPTSTQRASWSAAFVYCALQQVEQKHSYKYLAEVFNVTSATISKRVKLIEEQL